MGRVGCGGGEGGRDGLDGFGSVFRGCGDDVDW
jgi:hypothetical protein